jgi:hypothetical protein
MKTINERILFMIKHFCEGNKAEFARLMNEKPQTISSWLKRNNGAGVTNKILNKFPMVSPAWLLTGDGNMIAVDADQRIKDAMYREKDPFIPFPYNKDIDAPNKAAETTGTAIGSASSAIGKGLASSVAGINIGSSIGTELACAAAPFNIGGIVGSFFSSLFGGNDDVTEEEAVEVLKEALEDHKRISEENEELRNEVEYWRSKANNLEYQLSKTKAG